MNPLPIRETANSVLQNRINVSIVFNYIRERGPLYRAQIAKDLKLSAPAVSRAIAMLVDEGYVIETEKRRTPKGKRATHVLIDASKGVAIGVDLVKDPIRIAVTDLNCTIKREYEGFSPAAAGDAEARLVSELSRIIEDERLAPELKAIGIGIPAVVDSEGAVNGAVLYASLEGRNFRRTMEQRFGVPVFVENVVKLSALAELKYGEGRGCRNFVFLELSNGIGAGVILNEQLVRGEHGSAGEIGFLPIGRHGVQRRTGRKGTFEQVASVEALRIEAISGLEAGRSSSIREIAGDRFDAINAADVCRAASEGDALCREVVETVNDYLAVAVENLLLILDPERIVIGGDICRLPGVEELFVEPVRARVGKSIPFSLPDIRLSSLHEEAGVIGASLLGIDSLLVGKYPYRME